MAIKVNAYPPTSKGVKRVCITVGIDEIVMKLENVPDLINALCAIPQIAELNGSLPLVLYFNSEEDREEFAIVVKSGMKKVRSVKV